MTALEKAAIDIIRFGGEMCPSGHAVPCPRDDGINCILGDDDHDRDYKYIRECWILRWEKEATGDGYSAQNGDGKSGK